MFLLSCAAKSRQKRLESDEDVLSFERSYTLTIPTGQDLHLSLLHNKDASTPGGQIVAHGNSRLIEEMMQQQE